MGTGYDVVRVDSGSRHCSGSDVQGGIEAGKRWAKSESRRRRDMRDSPLASEMQRGLRVMETEKRQFVFFFKQKTAYEIEV